MHSVYFLGYQEDERVIDHWFEENLYRLATAAALNHLEATRGVWVLGERRNAARYAFAVFDGLVREVYAIEQWHRGGATPYEC